MKNQIFLISILTIFFFFNLAYAQYPQPPEPQPIFNFFFRIYKNDTVELIKLEQTMGYPSFYTTGDYKLKIVSEDGRILNESIVDIFFLYNKVKKNGVLVNYSVREFVDVYLSLPYHPEARKIELYHFDKLIYQTEVFKEEATWIEYCGNGVCDSWENYINCPKDCLPPTTTTSIKISKKIQTKDSRPYFFAIAIIGILFSIFLIYKFYMGAKTYEK